MKKNILILACLAVLGITFSACSNNTGSKTDTAGKADSSTSMKDTSMMKQVAVVYTCKMHPEVISDKPGKCPKCGMDLVKKEDIMKDSTMKSMKMDSTKH
ncbi:MAG TPA: heavy metal-binding domain-containing protein [Puia sp.]|nr:heavy metal-binding domain-containing protein [Puia sp.]